MKKKIFTFFLALVASVGTMFAEKVKIGDLYYDLINQTAKVTYKSCTNNFQYNADWTITTANIPASITYGGETYTVTSIGDAAFRGCSSLTSVTIPNSVTSIGSWAFYECKSLTSVTIPNSVESIGHDAFSGCSSLTSVTIPNNVTSIGESAFYYCRSLTSVTIPNSVTSIGERAFSHCTGLTSVTIPNSVTSIGYNAFYNVPNIVYSGSATGSPWGARSMNGYIDGYLVYSDKAKTNLLACFSAATGDITIPNSVTSIGRSAFTDCTGLTSVTIPNSVTSIGYGAFEHCSSLISVTIPNSVTSIGDYAFSGCSSLTSVTIPNSVTSIGDGAFYRCTGLTSVTIPNSVTSIGYSAFKYCSGLTSVTIPNSVTSIGYSAFSDCSGLKNVILGSSVKVLEQGAFYNCSSIESITCYSQRPPTVNTDAFYGLDYSTIVYVPADYLNTYQMHDAWGLYDVRPLGAKSTETTDIKVTPAENTADVAWPAVSGAATYELVIKDKSGNVICTLIFNAKGQLTQIAFNAPARNNAPQQTQAAGFSFTVTGLEEGTSYDLTITSKDNSGTTLDTKTISFTTSGDVPQGIDQVPSDQVQSTKVIKNGQILILRGDKTYTLTGQETIMP